MRSMVEGVSAYETVPNAEDPLHHRCAAVPLPVPGRI